MLELPSKEAPHGDMGKLLRVRGGFGEDVAAAATRRAGQTFDPAALLRGSFLGLGSLGVMVWVNYRCGCIGIMWGGS